MSLAAAMAWVLTSIILLSKVVFLYATREHTLVVGGGGGGEQVSYVAAFRFYLSFSSLVCVIGACRGWL